jgi:hypothetical protein
MVDRTIALIYNILAAIIITSFFNRVLFLHTTVVVIYYFTLTPFFNYFVSNIV